MYDFCIIGGGVIGCALARELSSYDCRICLVEKEPDVCMATSGANSGIVHGGFDAMPGTLMAKYNVAGAEMMEKEAKDLDVHYVQSGTIVIATSDEEIKSIENLLARGLKNGVRGLKIIDRDEILALEPGISDGALKALYSPVSGYINPFELTFALRENAEANGAEFIMDFEATAFEKNGESGILKAADGRSVEAKLFINAAGCGSARISEIFGDKHDLIFRKGEYLLYDHPSCVNLPVFQTPSKMGKGVLVSPTTSGNWFIGPTAVNIDNDLPVYDENASAGLIEASRKSCKNLNYGKKITSFTGVRAVSPAGDFIIGKSEKNEFLYNVMGICSPGLSSSIAIAKDVAGSFGLRKKADFSPCRKRIESINKAGSGRKAELIKEDRKYGNIICRCETVSEAEIVQAIRRGARTVDGVKKRLRTGMGRCQGGFCTSRIIEILSHELGIKPEQVVKKGKNSYMLTGDNK